ncbi:Uncharacterized protein DAT39_021099 [Clarias magur]|uniref:Uncharacterized protein n=1 Tax=Clarias magur TaxID=1594786 RepID=A0A8J4WQX8_CLAMG|nr:Uncharacterized protein DAT39_021099 [Clarias magur]
MKHNNTPRQSRTQLEASHLSAHSQRGAQAGEDKKKTPLAREGDRTSRRTNACLFPLLTLTTQSPEEEQPPAGLDRRDLDQDIGHDRMVHMAAGPFFNSRPGHD